MKSGMAVTYAATASMLPQACAAVLLTKHFAAQAPSAYPISKVVDLLRNMKAEIEKEGDSDEEVYAKLACWCGTNDKAKTKAIADAEFHLNTLQNTIDTNAALSSTLTSEVQGLETEIARNQKSLDEANALRKKQKAEFVGEEKEMVQSIQGLNAAIVVLSKHHGEGSASALATIKTQLQRHGALLRGAISPKQRRTLAAFVQAPEATYQAYRPQSGEIFGILKQMMTTFQTDLTRAQQEELADQQAYVGVKAAKEEEIASGQASLEDKKEQLVTANQAVAQASLDQEDTRNTLSADQQFLLQLKNKCSLTDQEWQDRQELRKAELAAVAEAIALLASDDARDLFSKNFNRAPGAAAAFVQLRQVAQPQAARRERAAALLAQVAARTGSPTLSVLATRTKLDTFNRVKKAIDQMIGQLTQESANEVAHRDACIRDLNTNQGTTAEELHTKKGFEVQVETLKLKVKGLADTIATLQAEIPELQTQKQRATENRAAEKAEFDAIVAEQQDAAALLSQALTVLQSQYQASTTSGSPPAGPPTLLQRRAGRYGPPAPEGFTDYEKSGGAVSVTALIEHIIKNCEDMEQASWDGEATAISSYNLFVQETEASVQAKGQAIVDRSVDKSSAEGELRQAESDLQGSVASLEALSTGLADLHTSCDYALRNFEVRQEARDQEVDALRQAKAFLAGME